MSGSNTEQSSSGLTHKPLHMWPTQQADCVRSDIPTSEEHRAIQSSLCSSGMPRPEISFLDEQDFPAHSLKGVDVSVIKIGTEQAFHGKKVVSKSIWTFDL